MAVPQRILITGAAGFVGGHLIPRLRGEFPDAMLTPCGSGAGMVPLDITDTPAVDAIVRETKPDAIVHLAAISAIPQARQDPGLAWRVNLLGTLALARAALRENPGCLFLYPSSADIYGRSFKAGVPVDENVAPAPVNTYGATKAAADLALGAMATDGLRAIRLRSFNHTGPGQSAEFVVPAFARQIARIEAGLQPPVMQVGALEPFRDFLDVRDVCEAYLACFTHADALEPGAVLNIASGTPRRIGDVLADLLRLAGVDVKVETATGLVRATDIPRAVGDASLARRLLGWAPLVPWEDTLRAVLADWRGRVRA